MKTLSSKLIPKLYDDVISPSAKEVGSTLTNVVKTALRPANGVVWTTNQAFDWVSERVVKYFEHREVSHARVVKPPVLIEGRVLQGLQTCGPGEDSQLRNMFAALLASSMDRETAEIVHPSFAATLSQLMPNEARLLTLIAHSRIMIANAWNSLCPRFCDSRAWSYYYYEAYGFTNIDDSNYWHYLESIQHLGIIEIHMGRHHQRDNDQDFLDYPEVRHVFDQWRNFASDRKKEQGLGNVTQADEIVMHQAFEFNHFRITRWGENLARACAAQDFYDGEKFIEPPWATSTTKRQNKRVRRTATPRRTRRR